MKTNFVPKKAWNLWKMIVLHFLAEKNVTCFPTPLEVYEWSCKAYMKSYVKIFNAIMIFVGFHMANRWNFVAVWWVNWYLSAFFRCRYFVVRKKTIFCQKRFEWKLQDWLPLWQIWQLSILCLLPFILLSHFSISCKSWVLSRRNRTKISKFTLNEHWR